MVGKVSIVMEMNVGADTVKLGLSSQWTGRAVTFLSGRGLASDVS